MICCSVEVWWEGVDSPCHEYNMSAVFATEQDYRNYDWAPADFGVPNPDQCAWDVTSYRVGFCDLPGWVQEWVETHGIPNGAIPDATQPEKPPTPMWVKAAFLEVLKHQHTNLMMDREPDADGDELYWEIDNRVLREFAASIGVEIPDRGGE